MELFFEIIFRWLIVRIFGVYSRYIFFKIVGRPKTINQLMDDKKSKDNNFSQDFYNAFIGLIVFCLFSIGIAYLIFSS